ncbi:MAG TPA: FAD-dependent oxidoreductase [Ramlibacter sp.]|uniref:NAD(P)/FAD-dependent oxidoreductase n=1 Tax=Ramlibacter sp. TaxID=1917967 RepID=UPI002BB217A4|nr:FAD-dependent oxidoreductase [Ramlibacter sp.]HVZ44844.1 FAD-dependent oxidoreductase [Ramlibacter sp.]
MTVRRVVVIGTGVIGLNVGLRLLAQGMQVEFVDPSAPGSGCSHGNAGVIAVDAAVPIGMPSMLTGAAGFLLRQQGPIVVKPAYFVKALPWLIRFLLACRPHRVEQISRALHSIARFALEDYERLFCELRIEDDIRRTGALMLYHSPASFAGAQAAIGLRRRRGANIEILDERHVRDMEPDVGPVHKGLYFPDYASLDSPALLCRRLADRATELGAAFHRVAADSIAVAHGRPRAIRCDDGRELSLDDAAVVVAAGAFSRRLAADVGCDIPLDTERGYHVEIENPGIRFSRPVLVSDGAFFASTMQGRLRLAGTVEIAGLERSPDWRRADAMVERARAAFPRLRAAQWTRWMGFRPSVPHSLPVIGASTVVSNAYVACGHGHLGMTLGAVTGALVADAILGREPKLDPRPFAPRAMRAVGGARTGPKAQPAPAIR